MSIARRRRVVSFAVAAAMFAPSIASAAAQPAPAASGAPAEPTPSAASTPHAGVVISGSVVAGSNGLPIGNASATLYRGAAVVATVVANADGTYRFADIPAGAYSIVLAATGYQSTRVENVFAVADSSTQIRTPLLAATSSSQALREIGSVRATSRGGSLASTSTIQHDLDPGQLQGQGFLRAAEALGEIPGVNITAGRSIGDDSTIDIRGMGAGEVRALLDGHPIGPIGVFNQDYYNYTNTPFLLLDNIRVTLGSGASGLYGVDVIGGTIDLQTLTPTRAPHVRFDQTFGNQGTLSSLLRATGTIGKLGYAVGHSVTGTYGNFGPQQNFQGSRPNNNLNLPNGGACRPGAGIIADVSTCNTDLNTYFTTGNYKVLNDIFKLKYAVAPSTSLTLTAYDGNTLTDNTGAGDNDNIPYDSRLAQIQSTPKTCAAGYLVTTDTSPAACETAQQVAAQTSGPYGGGQDRNRGTTLQDFSARVESSLGQNNLTFSAFRDYYEYRKNSSQAAGLDPTGTFFVGTGTYADRYLTTGLLASDDIQSANNDLGFGYFVEHQKSYGDNNAYDSTANAVTFVQQPILGEGDYSFFLRDNFTPNRHLAIYTNAWSRRSSVTQRTTFDPRVSLVYKPGRRDVFRITGGRADGDPAANIAVANSLSGFNNPSSLNPVCDLNLLNSVATAGNPAVRAERSNDAEIAYGHTFWADTSFNVVGYASSVEDQLFAGVFPITPFALQSPQIQGSLAGFASKINSSCGTNFTAQTISPRLGLSGVFNASSALFRGLEFTGRIRATRDIAVDFDYDIQSSQQFGEPLSVLQNNPFVLDGGQILAIPTHKGSLTFDYTHRNIEAQIQGYYQGDNNVFSRPAFTYFNAFVSAGLGHGLRATLSSNNLFDQASQIYGYFGHQLPNNENQYQAPYSGAIGQFLGVGAQAGAEQFGLKPRLVTFTLSESI